MLVHRGQKILLIANILIIMFLNKIEGQITFEKWYGGTNSDGGYDIQQTVDGGYIIVGYTTSYGVGMEDVFLIKTNSRGDTLWAKTYGGSLTDVGLSVQQTAEHGYIIAGFTNSYGAGMEDVYLIRTDSIGTSLWEKTYGGTNYEDGLSIQKTADCGYIIVGYAESYGAGLGDVYLIKTDSLGDTLWTKTYGGIEYDIGCSVQQTNDGGYIITGQTYSYGAGWDDVYLIKTDSFGDTLWTKTYGTSDCEIGISVIQCDNGDYIIAGNRANVGEPEDLYLIKTDSLGGILWTKIYGGASSETGISIQLTNDSGYIIAGYTGSYGAGLEDVYLIKIDSFGDTLWTKTYGGNLQDWGYSVRQTSDGGYIIVGYTSSYGAGNGDVYLIKTDSLGNITGIKEQKSSVDSRNFQVSRIFPNPFSTTTLIQYYLPEKTKIEINIYDIQGRLIKTSVKEETRGIHNVIWDGKDKNKTVPNGVYFCEFKTVSGFGEIKKLIKVK